MTWQCDGCPAQFDDPEGPEAVAHFTGPDRLPDCWGSMLVGGAAHAAFLAGTHPMETVLASVEDAAMDTGLIVEVLR